MFKGKQVSNQIGNQQRNFRLYKAKKQWVTACTTLLITLGASTVMLSANAHASEQSPAATPTTDDVNQDNDSSQLQAKEVTLSANDSQQPTTTDPTTQPSKTPITSEKSSTKGTTMTLTTSEAPNLETPQSITKLAAEPNYQVNDWDYTQNANDIYLTKYHGTDTQHIYIPNTVDFINAGKLNATGKAYITPELIYGLSKNAIDLTIDDQDNSKLYAKGSWALHNEGVANPSFAYGKWEHLNLANLDVSQITNMSGLFAGNKNLQQIDVSGWQTSNVTDMSGMFEDNSSLKELDLSGWQTGNVTTMQSMFNNCTSLASLKGIDQWDVSHVTNMAGMFGNRSSSPSSLQQLDLSKWQTGNVTDMSGMFSDQYSLQSVGNLSNWDTSKVTTMNSMFGNCSSLVNLGDLGQWDVSHVTNMANMFQECSSLTNLGKLDNWQTGNVTTMANMFISDYNLHALGNLSGWDTGKVTSMLQMFAGSGIKNFDLQGWNFSSIKENNPFPSMPQFASSGVKYMFANLVNPALIDLRGAKLPQQLGFALSDFVANHQPQPIVVLSADPALQQLNTATYNGTTGY